jgi:methyl-accepting chemotaxis protein
MSDSAEIDALLQKSAKLRAQLESESLSDLAGLGQLCSKLEEKLREVLLRAATARTTLERLRTEVLEFPDRIVEQLRAQETELRERTAHLGEGLEHTETRLVDLMETGRTSIEELLGSHLEQVTEQVNGVVEHIQEQADDLFDRTKDLRGSAEDLGTELLAESLPEGVTAGAEKLHAGMGKLRQTGLEELGKISDNVGGVQEKTQALTDLVEDIKPVLDLAQKLL